MDHSITDLNALVAKGKTQGYLTYDQVNDYLPDEAVNPEKLDNLLMALDEAGIELLTDPPADGPQPDDGAAAPASGPEEEIFRIPAEDLPKLSDDPIRMYLSQMAVIPLLTREQEISLAKKIEVTRKRFRRSVLGCNFAMQVTIETLDKVHQGLLPFDRTIKVSLTERLDERADSGPHAAQFENAAAHFGSQPRRFPQADPPQHCASRFGASPALVLLSPPQIVAVGRRVEPAHPPRAAAGEAIARILAADGCSAPQAEAVEIRSDGQGRGVDRPPRIAKSDAAQRWKAHAVCATGWKLSPGSSPITSTSSASFPAATCGWW